jgi:arylformamidase
MAMAEGLWHGYDKDELDDQYRASGRRVPNFADYVAKWVADGETLRKAGNCLLDVRFGSHPAEHFDVFPAQQKDAPIHVFIHGGYWQSLTSKEFSFVASGLVPAGITTVVINYEICPNVTMTELVRQVRAGVAYAHEHARDWGADPDRLTVSGHSAGGHLTAALMTTDWQHFAPGRPADVVKGGLALSGLYNLEPIQLCYVNDKLHMDKQEAYALSPTTHLTHARGALSLAVGGRESEQFHWQQEHFGALWTERTGQPPRVVDLPAHNHFSLLNELSNTGGVLAREVRHLNGMK